LGSQYCELFETMHDAPCWHWPVEVQPTPIPVAGPPSGRLASHFDEPPERMHEELAAHSLLVVQAPPMDTFVLVLHAVRAIAATTARHDRDRGLKDGR
jgi:hypothetical protein